MKIIPNWSIDEDHSKERQTSLLGRIVYVHCVEPMTNLDYVLSTAHIIGWDASKSDKDEGYFTVVSLIDGMTQHKTIEQLIKWLNEGRYVPISSTVLSGIMSVKQPLQ